MDALNIKNLSKSYASFELKGLELDLPQGCIMGLIGENGAGKSTAMKAVLNLIKPDSGEILCFGRPVTGESMEDIGVVFDEGCLPEKMTGTAIGKMLGRFYKNWDAEKYASLLNRLEVSASTPFGKLSRGMRMKLALAAAMSHSPKLLILDEPTSGLDVGAREDVLDLLLDFISDGEKSVLISSHIVTDLERICDYICFIHKGERLFLEEKDVLLEKYVIVKCSNSELSLLPQDHVVGYRSSHFGAEALMERGFVPAGLTTDRVGIEDIILFNVKGEKSCSR